MLAIGSADVQITRQIVVRIDLWYFDSACFLVRVSTSSSCTHPNACRSQWMYSMSCIKPSSSLFLCTKKQRPWQNSVTATTHWSLTQQHVRKTAYPSKNTKIKECLGNHTLRYFLPLSTHSPVQRSRLPNVRLIYLCKSQTHLVTQLSWFALSIVASRFLFNFLQRLQKNKTKAT